MLSFGFIIIYQYFLAPLLAKPLGFIEIDLPDRFWTLLEIGIGGYLVGRSIEKVAPKLAEAKTKQKQVEVDGQVKQAQSQAMTSEIARLNHENLGAKDLRKLSRLKKREERFKRGKERRATRLAKKGA